VLRELRRSGKRNGLDHLELESDEYSFAIRQIRQEDEHERFENMSSVNPVLTSVEHDKKPLTYLDSRIGDKIREL